jgi:hypothetical protein
MSVGTDGRRRGGRGIAVTSGYVGRQDPCRQWQNPEPYAPAERNAAL